MRFLILAVLFAVAAAAQTPSHSVTLNWVDSSNPTGTTYSVYRATGVCSVSSSFVKLASSVAVKTYLDTAVVPGNYCYQVTASYSGMESVPSPQALAPVPSFPPSSLSVQVQ